MNFQKSSKRPLTPPPLFSENHMHFFPKFMTEVSSIMAKICSINFWIKNVADNIKNWCCYSGQSFNTLAAIHPWRGDDQFFFIFAHILVFLGSKQLLWIQKLYQWAQNYVKLGFKSLRSPNTRFRAGIWPIWQVFSLYKNFPKIPDFKYIV